MIKDNLIIKFEGEEADNHRIPAYYGSQSIYGITRCLEISSHYLTTQKVRHRYPFTDNVELFLKPPKEGSLEQYIEMAVRDPEIIKGVTIGVTSGLVTAGTICSTKLIFSFSKYIICQATGLLFKKECDEDILIESYAEQKMGDCDAIVDAAEISLKDAHRIISNGSEKISLIENNNKLATLTPKTKEYINKTIFEELDDIQDLSVAALNGNTGHGRVYFHDLKKTVPFDIIKVPDHGTEAALSWSLDKYINKKPSDVSVRFRRLLAVDGRTKKIIILGAYKPEET